MAEDQLLLEVWDEDMMQAADFLGRMKIPLYKIIHGRVQQPILIRERLQDGSGLQASKRCCVPRPAVSCKCPHLSPGHTIW